MIRLLVVNGLKNRKLNMSQANEHSLLTLMTPRNIDPTFFVTVPLQDGRNL